MASLLYLRLPQCYFHGNSFELQGKVKLRANAPNKSMNNEKDQDICGISRSKFPCGYSSRITISTCFLSRALSSTVFSADSDQTNSENEYPVAAAHNPRMEFNRVNCLVWVLHESARSFSLTIQTHELARRGPQLAMAWVGVDIRAWHKHTAYQVVVYALLKAVIEVELFLSHKRSINPSPVHEILSPKANFLGVSIENRLKVRHPKLIQWFRMVELPRIAGLFIPLFKKWSMEYAGSGIAGIILAISCCVAVRKLGSGRISFPLFSVSIEDVLVELMDLSHSIVSVDKLHHLAIEAGFEEDFLSHFGTKVLPGKNIEEVEFWMGLIQKKLSTAFHRESVISGKRIFCGKVQENSLAILAIFAFLGRQTRLFLSGLGIKDLEEHVQDFLSYLECGCLFIYPEFSSLSEYQLLMEVVTDEIGWLDFYAAFPSIFNQEKRRSKQNALQAEKEIILYTVFTVCYDVFSGFAHFIHSIQQPLDANLLAFLVRSQSLLSICLEDYRAAYDRSGEQLKIAERGASDSALSLQMKGRAYSSMILEAYPKPTELMESDGHQHGSKHSEATNSAWLDSITLAELKYAAESKALQKSFFKKSTIRLISASTARTKDLWMGTQLLFIDIMDVMELLMKQLRGHKITKRERRKIERTLADLASLVPITILMLIPVSAVGHAAIFAAIQKYMPFLIPTPYSSKRLDVAKQLSRAKEMEV